MQSFIEYFCASMCLHILLDIQAYCCVKSVLCQMFHRDQSSYLQFQCKYFNLPFSILNIKCSIISEPLTKFLQQERVKPTNQIDKRDFLKIGNVMVLGLQIYSLNDELTVF